MRYPIAGATAYFAVLTAFAYTSDEVVPGWVAITVIFVLPVVAGLIAGLWALIVPPLVVLLALPAGYGSGELPIWFVMAFIAGIAIPGIIIGWGARWAVRYYARSDRTRATDGVNA